MKILTLLPILALFVSGNSVGQNQPVIPKLMTNPDFLVTRKVLDSVVFNSVDSIGGAFHLRKWEQSRQEEGNILESIMYYWNSTLRAWSPPRNRYVFGLDAAGRLTQQAHYTYMYSHGLWKGCDSDGCGKKEWAYDAMGNQILRTQSYWNVTSRVWKLFETQENLYDRSGNMVMKANTQIGSYDDNLYGSKDEYSFDNRGNQMGHVNYSWETYYRNDWYPVSKEEKTYDGNGNISMYMKYRWGGEWNENRYWNSYTKVELKYDADGRQTAIIFYRWDAEQKEWFNVFSDENVYNDEGRLTSGTEISNGYYGYYPVRKEYAYDSAGNRTVEIVTSWSEWSNRWEYPQKKEYTYDQAGHLTQQVGYTWISESGIWKATSKTEWSYDRFGNQVFNASWGWSEEFQKFVGNNKGVKVFDDSSFLIMEAYFQWDYQLDKWVGSPKAWDAEKQKYLPGKLEYGYDDSGRLVLYAAYRWDRVLDDWGAYDELAGKHEWEYDSNGKLFQQIEYNWDAGLSNWTKVTKYVLMSDEQGDPTLQNQYTWDPDLLEWELLFRYNYYYRSPVTGIPEVAENDISVWPNPTSGIINISGLLQPAGVRVFSVRGELLKSEPKVEHTIDMSDLPPGLYYLNMATSKGNTVRKIMISR